MDAYLLLTYLKFLGFVTILCKMTTSFSPTPAAAKREILQIMNETLAKPRPNRKESGPVVGNTSCTLI